MRGQNLGMGTKHHGGFGGFPQSIHTNTGIALQSLANIHKEKS